MDGTAFYIYLFTCRFKSIISGDFVIYSLHTHTHTHTLTHSHTHSHTHTRVYTHTHTDPANFVKYLSVMRELMKLKFVDAKCLEEELEELHSRQSVMEDNVGLSEEDLLEKVTF